VRYGFSYSFRGKLSFGFIANAELNFSCTTINDRREVVFYNPSIFVCSLAVLAFGENFYDVHNEKGSGVDTRKEKHR